VARLCRFFAVVLASIAVVAIPTGARSADAGTYTISSGDTLSGIAARFGVRLSALLAANNLTISTVIQPGQRLTIPGSSGGGGSPGGSNAAQYTVRHGDSLFAIANRHGITLAALLQANGLTITTVIHPGQRLTIPGSSGGGGSPGGSNAARYTVRAGDSLFAIANRHGVTLAALLRANSLTTTTVIHPGQRLTIPGSSGGVTGGSGGSSGGSGGAQYTVRPGDSLGAIADRHHVTLTALLAANSLTMSSVIHPGQQLTLPAGAVASPVDRVLSYALAQVGKPYRFFAKGPEAFDCSGLTLAAYRQIGITLIHHSASQARRGTAVDFHNQPIRPGDLVFMATNGSTTINHVGIAINANMWVQARSSALGVRLTAIPPDSLILAVRRFIPAD
jgi:peptidoglycan DL-endopeptidase LytE